MNSLTEFKLKLSFDDTSVESPWTVNQDSTDGKWQANYQRWGMLVLEETGTGCERAITVQMTLKTRERLIVLVTLVGVGQLIWKSEIVRSNELALAVNRLVNLLLQ